MSHFGYNLPTLADLGNHDLLEIQQPETMTRDSAQKDLPEKKKKKVNGFIGFRCKLNCLTITLHRANALPAYYSALFSRYQQKQRSPFMTALWKQDPFHNEWDFICSTYSTIRSLLGDEGITLQAWISFAVVELGLPKREDYMRAMGWALVKHTDGSMKLQRAMVPAIDRIDKPMDTLSLFTDCIKAGMRIADPEKIITYLAEAGGDVMCINTKPSSRRPPAQRPLEKKEDGLVRLMKRSPELVMSQLLGIPFNHPRITSGVDVYNINSLSELSSVPQLIADRGSHTQPLHLPQGPTPESEFDAVLRALWSEDIPARHNLEIPNISRMPHAHIP